MCFFKAFIIVSEVSSKIAVSVISLFVFIKYAKALAIPQLAIKSGKTLIFSSANSPIFPKNISLSENGTFDPHEIISNPPFNHTF